MGNVEFLATHPGHASVFVVAQVRFIRTRQTTTLKIYKTLWIKYWVYLLTFAVNLVF